MSAKKISGMKLYLNSTLLEEGDEEACEELEAIFSDDKEDEETEEASSELNSMTT